MKVVLAIFFTVITMLSASQHANPLCDDSGENGHIVNSLAKDSNSIKSDIAHQRHESSENCAGSGHSCHLGHCSFTVQDNPTVIGSYVISSVEFVELNFSLSDFPFSLFRPPIA